MHVLLNNNVLKYSKYISYFELLFYKYKNRIGGGGVMYLENLLLVNYENVRICHHLHN